MLKELSPRDAWKLLEEGKARLFDIREPDEIEAMRAVHAEAAPLSLAGYMNLPPLAPGTAAVFTCHSGRRVRENEKAIRPLAAGGQAYALAGGMEAWLKEGLPVKRGHRLSIERQVRIGAGALVAAGSMLSLAWPSFILLPLFVGCGLVFAGVTGFCGLGLALKAMPWNK
jgi:rhodanese-related sulfurtransferase